MTNPRILILGAGSIGKRHLDNLQRLGVRDLAVHDLDAARAEAVAAQHGSRVFARLDEALRWQPHLALIATPNHLHVAQATECAQAGADLFIEKPLGTTLDGVAELISTLGRLGRRAFVGCNLRFDDVYAGVDAALDRGAAGRVFSAQLRFGYDLRLWRPGVDYRQVYSAHREQGGGILLDAIHELDLASWWFGLPRRVLSLPRTTGALEADVEDVADSIVEFRSGVVASLHLNYLDPVYRRSVDIAGSAAVIEADFARRQLAVRTPGRDSTAQSFDDDRNAMYLRELQALLAALDGGPTRLADIEDGRQALALALSARAGGIRELSSPVPQLHKVPIVIQARLGSTRLPGKVLKPAVGRPMLELLVERLRRAHRVDRIILATSEAPADRDLVHVAERLGLDFFVGSEDDVLGRYLGAVRQYDLPSVVRITADCPLMDPAVVDAAIERFCSLRPDYLSNVHPRAYPDGLDVEVVSREALERAGRQALDRADREHVTRYIVRHPERFELASLPHPDGPKLASLRWTLDRPADYEFIRAVFEELYPANPQFGMTDILRLVASSPSIQELAQAAKGASR